MARGEGMITDNELHSSVTQELDKIDILKQDIGDVSTLPTTSKEVVGAIKEQATQMADLETVELPKKLDKTTDNYVQTLSIVTGQISDGGTIPQTTGYTNYKYFVSPRLGEDSGGEYTHYDWIKSINGINCFVDSNRVVTAKMKVGLETSSLEYAKWYPITVNYIEFAWK